MKENESSNKVFTFALETNGWGELFPARQSSMYGSMIISHVYESLVNTDLTGGYSSGLAKTWDVNDDHTVYSFVIDTNRKFSDGTGVTAGICKDSLLHSLKMEAATTNRTSLDVLYSLKGYDKFEETGDIEGLVVEGDNILRMYFKKPFRAVLGQLATTRYGISIRKNGSYFGTGPYIYESIGNDIVALKLNPYYNKRVPEIKNIKIIREKFNSIHNKKSHASLIPFSAENYVNDPKNIHALTSLLLCHRLIVVNGMKDRVFSDRNLRKAIQFILHDYYSQHSKELEQMPYFRYDKQPYQNMFPGRLDEAQVDSVIMEGKEYVEALKKISQKTPIKCVARADVKSGFCKVLENYNIKTEVYDLEFSDVKKAIYHDFKYDLVSYGVTFSNSDPDAVYHFLGKNGALWSPMSSRQKVEDLIEEGRGILDVQNIDQHYKKVTRAILEEVPAIYLGSQGLYVEYDADQIEPIVKNMAKRYPIDISMLKWR